MTTRGERCHQCIEFPLHSLVLTYLATHTSIDYVSPKLEAVVFVSLLENRMLE